MALVHNSKLFDTVIQNCPEALQWALFHAYTVGWFEQKEQGWLEMLRANNSNFSQQAYGELLLIHYLQYQDEWSVERIHHHLATQDSNSLRTCSLQVIYGSEKMPSDQGRNSLLLPLPPHLFNTL